MRTVAAAPPPSPDAASGARPEDVFTLLGTDPGGLDEAEVERRRARYGPNTIESAQRVPLARRLTANFTHVMALLLWAAAAMAFAAALPELGVAICTVNLINGSFSFWQEYKAEQATAALRRLLPVQARVLRGGRERKVPAEELVPGDVLLLSEGDRVSADARVVADVELRVDQSTLTGESHPVRKSSVSAVPQGAGHAELTDTVFAGTSVAAGRGTAVVSRIGMDTEFGRIARLTQGMAREPSPLQRELARLSRVVGAIAVSVGVLFFVLAQLFTPMEPAMGFVFALGMIVALVPEGLLPTVTLALAMGTQRMAKRNALVKRLSAVETLGSTTVICTDKTGTLTQNEMTVRHLYLPTGQVDVSGTGYQPKGDLLGRAGPLPKPVAGDLRMALLAGALANDARLVPEDTGRWSILGDPTEAALKVVAMKAGIDLDDELRRAPRVLDLPFDAARKRMSTVHRQGDQELLFVKGAPRELLALCTHARVNGRDVPLDATLRAGADAANDAFCRDALRVLAVAMRALPPGPVPRDADLLERDLVFLGLVAMMDPPHPEVADAVQTCRAAGIRVVMMTGDYGLTAESIARRVGLLQGGSIRIVNGDELERLDDDALTDVLRTDVLFARTTPEHKLRVVRTLQAAGHVVAVTGDGVNDAPALKRADIGVAMGRAGTDVAKEAADVILLDDNFASIVNAVEEGRTVYANIKRFTSYIFTSNTPEAVPFVLFALSGGRIPLALGVMHILAIDLGTDLVPALALGTERPEPGVMERPPRRRDEHLVTRSLLLRAYAFLGLLQTLAVMAAFYWAYWNAGYAGRWLDLPGSGALYRSATAMALAAVVTTQIGNLFAHRTERESILRVGLASNRLAFVGIATELALISLIIYVPALQHIVGTGAFPPGYWALLFAFAPLLLVADELRKTMLRHRRRSP